MWGSQWLEENYTKQCLSASKEWGCTLCLAQLADNMRRGGNGCGAEAARTCHRLVLLHRCHSDSSSGTAQHIYACDSSRGRARQGAAGLGSRRHGCGRGGGWAACGPRHSQITASISSLPLPIGTSTCFWPAAMADTRREGAGTGTERTAPAPVRSDLLETTCASISPKTSTGTIHVN